MVEGFIINVMKISRNEVIAAACHCAWYSYTVLALGEAGEPYATAPKWQIRSIAEGINFWDTKMKELNLEGKAESDIVQVLSPLSHMNWMDQKISEGWVYGSVKDAEHKTHPCLKDYSKLPQEQKKKDEVVIRAYLAMRKAMGEFMPKTDD